MNHAVDRHAGQYSGVDEGGAGLGFDTGDEILPNVPIIDNACGQ